MVAGKCCFNKKQLVCLNLSSLYDCSKYTMTSLTKVKAGQFSDVDEDDDKCVTDQKGKIWIR